MPTRKIFADDNSKLELYVNADNKLYIEVASREDAELSGFIVLDQEDVEELQVEISNYLTHIKSNGKGYKE